MEYTVDLINNWLNSTSKSSNSQLTTAEIKNLKNSKMTSWIEIYTNNESAKTGWNKKIIEQGNLPFLFCEVFIDDDPSKDNNDITNLRYFFILAERWLKKYEDINTIQGKAILLIYCKNNDDIQRAGVFLSLFGLRNPNCFFFAKINKEDKF